MKQLKRFVTRLGLFAALALALVMQPVANAANTQQLFPCLTIYAEGSIGGIVRDSNGAPLGNVGVTAFKTTGDLRLTAATNAAGEYTISKAPIGTYLIRFRPAAGPAQVAWYDGHGSSLGATPVTVTPGTMTGNIDAMLPDGVQFEITVRDPEGDSVSQTDLSVYDATGAIVASGSTDIYGYALTRPGLPAGKYRIAASANNRRSLMREYYNHQRTLEDANELTVTQPSGIVKLPLTLQRGARVSGTVTDAATGNPRAGIYVLAYGPRGEAEVETDTNGQYTLQGLASGMYRLAFYTGKPEINQPIPITRTVTVSAPLEVSHVDVALVQGGAISGRVTKPDGTPIVDFWVQASDGYDEGQGAYTDGDGNYAIYGLHSGQYKVEFQAGQQVSEYYNDRPDRAHAETVTVVAPSMTTGIDAVLAPGGVISGNVTDPDGAPVSSVVVSLIDATTGAISYNVAQTDATGEYRTASNLKNGTYFVRFAPPSSTGSCSLALSYYGNAATTASATPVQVTGSQPVGGIDAALSYGGLLTGQITDTATGMPLNNATITIYDATGAVVQFATTRYLGRYRTAYALPAGPYRVQVASDDYATMFYGGAFTLEAATTVQTGMGDINVALSRGGTIRGMISAADTGAPLEYAEVTLYAANGAVVGRQYTSIDGTYRFQRTLPSGTYRVGVAAARNQDDLPYFTGYRAIFSGGATTLANAQPISLVAPQSRTVNLAMPRARTLMPRIFLPLVRR